MEHWTTAERLAGRMTVNTQRRIAGMEAEIIRLRQVVEAAGAKFHELDLPVYADLCLDSRAFREERK